MNTDQGALQAGTRTQNLLPLGWPFFITVLALFLLFSLFPRSSFSYTGKDTDKDKDLVKHFGLIFGTAYGPDDRPFYGARIEIHPAGQKNPHWERFSDHQGEFALRVPPGPGDYVVTGEAEIVPMQNGKPQKKKKIKAERTVHVQGEEREDVGLHLAD